MINWYFLYIHQEIDKIWHHQTCQVNLEGKVAPICSIQKFNEYCDGLQEKFNGNSIPFIRCPKTYCGCGLCVPKAKNNDMAKTLFNTHAPKTQPAFMTMQEEPGSGTLKSLVYKYDKENNNDTLR